MSFPSFTGSDFLAFEEKKQKSKRYNKERKPVWKKLKLIRDFVDVGLEKKGISLQGKVSNYWPNVYNHYRVNGVWIGYSDRDKKYYEYPHLSIGVYNGFIFVGFVINESAVEYQENFAETVESQPDLFLNYFKGLNKDRRVIWYDDLEILENPKKNQLRELSEKMREDWGWLSVGEFLSTWLNTIDEVFLDLIEAAEGDGTFKNYNKFFYKTPRTFEKAIERAARIFGSVTQRQNQFPLP